MHLSADISIEARQERSMGMVLGRISVSDVFCEVGQGRRELSGLGMKSGVIWTWMVILGGAADVVNGTIGVVGFRWLLAYHGQHV